MRGSNIPKKIKISLRNLQNKVPLHLTKIHNFIKQLALYKRPYLDEISVIFVDDKKIRVLNKRFLKLDRSTDVLAFKGGDIAISIETAQRNSRRFKTSLEYEICLYLVHAILHLSGYDDKHTKDRKIMREKEQGILRNLKLNYDSEN